MNEIRKNLLEIYKKHTKLSLISKAPTPNPDAAPEPDKPTKWSLPILLANSDIPTFEIKITRVQVKLHCTNEQFKVNKNRFKQHCCGLFSIEMEKVF